MSFQMKRTLFTAVAMALIISCSSVKWYPIDKGMLAAEECKAYPEAHAEILYKKMEVRPIREGNVNVSTDCKYLYTEQRKIYTSEGMDYADVRIPLYLDMAAFKVVGRTVHPDGSEVPLDTKTVFTKTYDDVKYKVFAFPDVTPGSIVEYQYSYSIDMIHFLLPFDFQDDIPVRKAEFILTYPVQLDYTIAYHNKPINFLESSRVIKIMDKKFVEYSLIGENLEPIKQEVFGPANEYQTTTIGGTLEHIQKYPMITTWKDLLPHINFQDDITSCKKAREITENAMGNDVEIIYNWIQENIKFDGGRSFSWSAQTPEETLNRKSGDNSDLAVLLISMLREVGIDAYPVLCRFRETGPIIKDFYSPFQFDHVIVRAETSQRNYFLDPTLQFAETDELYWNVQATEGLLIESKKIHKFITLPGTERDDNELRGVHHFQNIDSGSPQVTTRLELNGVHRSYLLERLDDAEEPKEFLKNFLVGDDILCHIDTFTVEDASISIEYTLDELVMKTRERLLFNPQLYHLIPASVVTDEHRKNDYWFGYPTRYLDEIVVDIPEGYAPEAIPDAVILGLDRKGLDYKCSFKQKRDSIVINRELSVSNYRLSRRYSDVIQGFFRDIMDVDGNQVILVKD